MKTDAFVGEKFRMQPLALFEWSPSRWPGSALTRSEGALDIGCGRCSAGGGRECLCRPSCGKSGAGERRSVPKSTAQKDRFYVTKSERSFKALSFASSESSWQTRKKKCEISFLIKMYNEDVHCEIDLWYRSKLRDVPLIITGVKVVVSCSSVNTVKADLASLNSLWLS